MTDSLGTDTSTTTIMFTDLVGSTELLERLGDDAGHEWHQRHLALLRRATADFGGGEVKALGDGLMVAFSSATAAVRCAIAMQEAVSGEGAQLRVGIVAGVSGRKPGGRRRRWERGAAATARAAATAATAANSRDRPPAAEPPGHVDSPSAPARSSRRRPPGRSSR